MYDKAMDTSRCIYIVLSFTIPLVATYLFRGVQDELPGAVELEAGAVVLFTGVSSSTKKGLHMQLRTPHCDCMVVY